MGQRGGKVFSKFGVFGAMMAAFALNAADDAVCAWSGDGFSSWRKSSQVKDLSFGKEGVSFRIDGQDSQLGCKDCSFVSSPKQLLRVRVRSEVGGKAEIFWRPEDEPALKQSMSASFHLVGDGQWHDYVVRPFWAEGKRIVELRFDPPNAAREGALIELSKLSVERSASGAGPVDADVHKGVMFKLKVPESRFCTVGWTPEHSQTMCRHEFRTAGDGQEHTYWLDLSLGNNWGVGFWFSKNWKGKVAWFDIMDMRRQKSLPVKELTFLKAPPQLPPDIVIDGVCPGDGINREGQEAPIEFTMRNFGTVPARNPRISFDPLPEGLEFAKGASLPVPDIPPSTGYDSLGGRLPNQIVHTVRLKALKAGKYAVTGTVSAEGARTVPFSCRIDVLESLNLPKMDSVPEPKPVRGDIEIGAVSFPGWRLHRWDRIRNYTPERKPLLGWYDEGSPEAIDWQIKWLAENGISYLLVDWFPRKESVTGKWHLRQDHWIRGFEKAKWRKYLKWAVFWENTMRGHDLAFVRKTAKYMIDNYFGMPEYYKIDGKPVIMVWNPGLFDTDMPGFGCKGVLDTVREMAKEAGYPGVWFIANGISDIGRFKAMGFDMTASYRYKGEGQPGGSAPVEGRRPFSEVAATSLQHWRSLKETGILPFLPSLTSGWDDRPWNGDHGIEIYGRTPELFAKICRDARTFAKESGIRNFLLGPLNEWGEGSYIEPCREFGFGMYEAVREALCVRPSGGWPLNFTPKDVGMDIPPQKPLPLAGDVMTLAEASGVRLKGNPGEKMDRFFNERIVSEKGRRLIFDEAREAFAKRDDDCDGVFGRWRGEFWGKQMLSTARVAQYLNNPGVSGFVRDECFRAMKHQDADGYLGSYADKEFVRITKTNECYRKCGWYPCWNIWNRKYSIWGMYEAYKATGDEKILESAVSQLDQLVAMMRKLKLRLHETGTLGMAGMPSMSILKPLLLMYRETGKTEYLAFARETVRDWDRSDGAAPNFLRNAMRDDPLHSWYPAPQTWAKAYEMMSCLEGLLEYYRLTGEKRVFDAVCAIRDNLEKHEKNALGGVGYCDKFYAAAKRMNALTEVCDSVHWIRLNRDLFMLTGDAKYLDAMEETYFNAFLGGILRDGTYTAFAVRAAQRHHVDYQCGYKYNHCCADNAPRTFVDMAEATVTRDVNHTLFVNFYQDADVTVDGARIEISGGYPVKQSVTVKITTDIRRNVRFRIPGFGLKPTTWRKETVPAGGKTFQLWFGMKPQLVERDTARDPEIPEDPAKSWFFIRYVTKPNSVPGFDDIRKGFRTDPAAYIKRGPLVLAKAKRIGDAREQIFPDASVNGKGYSVSLKPVQADGVWGAWEATLTKPGEKSFKVGVCDFQSAGDENLPEWADAFSIWF